MKFLKLGNFCGKLSVEIHNIAPLVKLSCGIFEGDETTKKWKNFYFSKDAHKEGARLGVVIFLTAFVIN